MCDDCDSLRGRIYGYGYRLAVDWFWECRDMCEERSGTQRDNCGYYRYVRPVSVRWDLYTRNVCDPMADGHLYVVGTGLHFWPLREIYRKACRRNGYRSGIRLYDACGIVDKTDVECLYYSGEAGVAWADRLEVRIKKGIAPRAIPFFISIGYL